MGYLGNTPTTQSFISGTDYFNGDGSTTAFTLTRTVASVNDIEAVVNNVVQQPNSAYTLSGTTITFTSAPSAGTNNIYVRYLSTTTQSITPSQNTVSYSTLNTDMQGLFGQSFTNRIINGAMMIDQRNAGAAVTINASSNIYTLDRWFGNGENADGVFTVDQVTDAPTGFINSAKLTVTTADASIGSTQFYIFRQYVEGYNVADLGFGTANAKTITASFWVRSSLTGTFSGAINNATNDRNYPFTYSISAADTWEYKTVTIPGDTTGTWLTDSNRGIALTFSLGCGSSCSATAGSWSGASSVFGATGSTNLISTNGATFYITGVQLEKGSTATSFDYRPYGTELQLCQRYFLSYGGDYGSQALAGGGFISTTTFLGYCGYPVPMRAAATLTTSGSFDVRATTGYPVTVVSGAPGASSAAVSAVVSGATAGQGAILRSEDVNNGKLLFSAEL